jgi:hypothetical protein
MNFEDFKKLCAKVLTPEEMADSDNLVNYIKGVIKDNAGLKQRIQELEEALEEAVKIIDNHQIVWFSRKIYDARRKG